MSDEALLAFDNGLSCVSVEDLTDLFLAGTCDPNIEEFDLEGSVTEVHDRLAA